MAGKSAGKRGHVRRCLMCKELLDQCAGGPGEEYDRAAMAVIARHVEQDPEPDNVSCPYTGCVHHENVERDLALKMVRLGRGDKPWRDLRGVLVSNIALEVRQDDHPGGFDMKRQDVMHRHFKYLAPHAGIVYCRLAPKRTTLHVWVSPAYVSRREDVQDVATVEDVIETFSKQMPALKKWCLRKFSELKELAEMDLQF